MPFKKIEDEIEACTFNKIDNRKTRRICHLVNSQVTQAHCVCHKRKYRKHMRPSFGPEICWKMGIKIDETYHVVRCCCP